MHKFCYENDYEGQLNTTVEFSVPSDADLDEMIEQFQLYLKSVGYNFDGDIKICSNNKDVEVGSSTNYNMPYGMSWTQDMSGTGNYLYGIKE